MESIARFDLNKGEQIAQAYDIDSITMPAPSPEKWPEARRLMTHPGVGPLTALAFVLIIGEVDRFRCGKQIASYLGLVPLEESSGNRRRLFTSTREWVYSRAQPWG